MKRSLKPHRGGRRGSSITEMAIVLPIFFLFVFGIIEFGRAMVVLEIITNAAREGARRAVVAGATDAQAYATMDTYLSNENISGYSRTISPSVGTAAKGDPITVTVTVPYNAVDYGIMFFLGDNTLSAEVIMRKE